jgi:alkylation response protein AidB-like acyl-CoA dehydrogenase
MSEDSTHQRLLEQAERLAAPLAARAAEIEARRSLPPDIAQAFAQAGLYRLLTPSAFGGHEVHAATFFDVVEAIARHDAATAWCCFIANTACVLAAYLPPASAAALFGRADLQAAGVFAPRGQAVAETLGGVAGWRISGRWAWGSATHNAHLISGGCVVVGADGRPELLRDSAPEPAAPHQAPRGSSSEVAKPHSIESAPQPAASHQAPRGGSSEVAKPHSLESAPQPAAPRQAPQGGSSEVAKPHSLESAPQPAAPRQAPQGGSSEVAKPHSLENSQPRVLSALFERHQVRLLDNWHSVGLGGSGSGEFEVEGVFVPAERCASLFGAPQQPGVLYRFPVFGLLALGIAAVASGIARQALDALVDLAADKLPQASSKTLAQRPAVQEAVAKAEAEWRSARAFLVEAVHAAWDGAAQHTQMPVPARRDLRLAATHLTHSAAAVTTRMYTLGGGSAVFAASPLQRCLRDVHVATQHMMVGESTWELTGRLLLNQPTSVAML